MRETCDFIEKAEKFLNTAERDLNAGDHDSCVSRCYYAMFFMAEVVLLTKGLKASSHKGVISMFGKHFVKTAIFDRELGKALNDAYDKRVIGDYGVGITVSRHEAGETLQAARNFVGSMKIFLEKQ